MPLNNEEFDGFEPDDEDFPEGDSDDFDDSDDADDEEEPAEEDDDDDAPWQSVSAARAPAEPEPGSGPPNVRHPRFGDGWIVARRDDKVDVVFQDGAKRTLLKRFLTDI